MTHNHVTTKPHIHKDPSGHWTYFADECCAVALRYGALILCERLNRAEGARRQRRVPRS